MPEEKQITVNKREITSQTLKEIRSQGLFPANVYGSGTESLSISVDTKEFIRVFRIVGETEVLYLKVEEEKESRPTLVREIQTHPVTNQIVHVDFLQIDLSQKITATVPLVFLENSPVITEKRGLLLEIVKEITVNCLPQDIPTEIEVDTLSLQEIGDVLTVKDLNIPENVEIEQELDEAICKIAPLQTEEKEEEEIETEEEEGTENADENLKEENSTDADSTEKTSSSNEEK